MVNELYLAVLPMIHLGATNYGMTEQVITMMADSNQATSFFPDEVDDYINIVARRTQYLTGGHVVGFEFFKQPAPNGRVIVRVVQNVA